MFDIGRFRAHTCHGLSRRAFLKIGASLPVTAGLSAVGGPVLAGETGRAKSVLFIWLWGAPSHLDTFDPKPHAPSEFRGPLSTIATQTPGLRFTELFPKLAQRSDRFSLIRSNVTNQPGHPDAGTVALTGFKENPEPVKPNFGSIVAKHRGHGGRLPPFVSVGRGIPRDVVRIIKGYGGGTLGGAYDPLQVGCSEQGRVQIPALDLLDGLTPGRLDDRQHLLRTIDGARRRLDAAGIADWNRLYQRAYGLLTDPAARNAFNLTREKQSVRDSYGQTTFGQSCLLARRLVEARVPYVQVNWSRNVECMTPNCDFGWDTHILNFELLTDRHGPIFDRVFSALLDDLRQRGLLETTLVVAMGEFGRTPRINNRASRDHWPRCYFSLWAGGGIQPGRVVGESDKLGQDPLTLPVTPLMVGTTIAELAGINTQARAEMNVLAGGRPIEELL